MPLPTDLFLVRHGQSEANLANRLSEAGDHSAYTPEFMSRHTASFRLTERGRTQAILAGAYIRKELFKDGVGFDRYVTSEYVRAMETAARLQLPGASWFCDPYLSERDWGDLDNLPENERQEKFGEALRRRQVEPFFWRPPNGESFAQLCLRVDRALHTLHRECGDKRVVFVMHGETMRAFEVRLERMSQIRFKELIFSEDPMDRIHNCEILHYTRRNPATGQLAPYANWKRKIRPTESPFWCSEWTEIERPRYTNAQLLDMVSRVPAMLK